MKTVLITGASGQLANCFKKLEKDYPNFNFIFRSSSELNIADRNEVEKQFSAEKINYCINCAAYTNVEKAESEKEKAFKINAEAVNNLAKTCKESGAVLIHFSTDYVFNGKSSIPYKEEDQTNPINIYGASKLQGEDNIRKNLEQYFIFRTSWLYSEFGHNFFNTIRRKAEEKAELNIITSQKGTPTNANDLAEFVLQILAEENTSFGLYHYSNLGEATWYDFAQTILKISGMRNSVNLNQVNNFKTIAARPEYSVLDKNKILNNFNIPVLHWRESLEQLLRAQIQKK